MALEMKGLKASMMRLQSRVNRLNAAATAADEKGAMLESYLGDIGKQIGSHVDDIEFAANVLGNSGPPLDEPEKLAGRLNGGQAPVPPSIENNAPPASVSPPEVGPSPFQS